VIRRSAALTEPALRRALRRHSPVELQRKGVRRAAVLLPFRSLDQGRLELMFIRRSRHLKDHPGQVAFPGGRADPDDGDLVGTALRETEEELGLSPAAVQILGCLDDTWVPVSNHVVRPVVGLLGSACRPRILTRETEEILRYALDSLARSQTTVQLDARYLHGMEQQAANTRRQPVKSWEYPMPGALVWGMTARILHNLLEILLEAGGASDHLAEPGTKT